MTTSEVEAAALGAVDEAAIGRLLLELLEVPSVTGSAAESDLQHVLAGHLERADLDVDLWSMNLPELRAHPGFPGGEAPRTEAWGLVGSTQGDDGPTLADRGLPSGALPTAVISGCTPERASPRCSTGPATSGSPTARRSRSGSARSSPSRGRWCSPP